MIYAKLFARLIRSEEASNRPNKAKRIEQLRNFQKKAQLLADARNNSLEKLTNLTKYEKTVQDAIHQAETEDDLAEESGGEESQSFADKAAEFMSKVGAKVGAKVGDALGI